jgi:hypothetical protein
MKRIRNICKNCGVEFTPIKGFWSICGVRCRYGSSKVGSLKVEYTDVDSIKEFKRTEKLKKSNTMMDLRFITDTYNVIYYLYNNDEITYIGQSRNVNDFTRVRRVIEHFKNGKKFDKFVIRNVDLRYNLDAIEAFEILTHKPKENKSVNFGYHRTRSLVSSVKGHLTKEDERYMYLMGKNQAGQNDSINPIRIGNY